jgi:hypothetical protein
LREGEDAGEEHVRGGQIPEEDPGRKRAADRARPDGLDESFEIFRIEWIGDPGAAAGDEVEKDGGSGGTEQQGGEAAVGERLAKEEDHQEGNAGGHEVERVCGVTDAKWEGHHPNSKRDCKSAPTWGEKGTAKKQRGKWLEVWQGLWECAAEHAKGDEKSYNQYKREITFHDGARIVDFY